MATFVPNGIFSSLKGCELAIAEMLSRLDDDCIVYYEPVIAARYPDFVIILPRIGVLIIEVKGWKIGDLQDANGNSVRHIEFGAVKHPQRQARDYMLKLMDRCKKSPLRNFLFTEGGNYDGRLSFPFAYTAVFCNIDREDFKADFQEIFPFPQNVSRDELRKFKVLKGRALERQLAGLFDPSWPIDPMSQTLIDAIRLILHPGSKITDLKVLDVLQEQLAYAIGPGHRLIYGVAGSGKTVILIARARMLAAKSKNRILILCYNKLLKQKLEMELRDNSNIDIYTFHGWAHKLGVIFDPDETREAHAARLLAVFEAGQMQARQRYDAVLVDEVQFATRDWLKCAVRAMSDGAASNSTLLVTGDGTQNYFKRRDWTWKDAGINIVGRTKRLTKNYRNTKPILETASRIVPTKITPDDEKIIVVAHPDDALRDGPNPDAVRLSDRVEEAKYAAALIETWLRGGIMLRGERVPVAPDEVAVLYLREGRSEKDAMKILMARLNAFAQVVKLTPSKQDLHLADPGVKVLTVQSAVGLQFKCVILIWADQFPQGYGDRDDKALLYAGLTRAEEILIITYSDDSGLIGEIAGLIRKKCQLRCDQQGGLPRP